MELSKLSKSRERNQLYLKKINEPYSCIYSCNSKACRAFLPGIMRAFGEKLIDTPFTGGVFCSQSGSASEKKFFSILQLGTEVVGSMREMCKITDSMKKMDTNEQLLSI